MKNPKRVSKNQTNNKSNKNSQNNTTIPCTKNMLWSICPDTKLARSDADGGLKKKLSRERAKRFAGL